MTSRRAPLLFVAAGAVIVLLSFLGTIAELAGLAAMVLGTVLSAAEGRGAGPDAAGVRWWRLIAVGTAIVAVSLPLSILLETVGGLMTALGAAMAIAGAVFGYPLAPQR